MEGCKALLFFGKGKIDMADNKSILVGQASQLELNNVYEETQRFREKCTFENQAFFNDKVKFDDRVDFNYNTYMHEKME